MTQHGRGVLLDHHPPSHPTGHLPQREDLVAAISWFIEGWNHRCAPFVWTKAADQILPHASRQRTSDARH